MSLIGEQGVIISPSFWPTVHNRANFDYFAITFAPGSSVSNVVIRTAPATWANRGYQQSVLIGEHIIAKDCVIETNCGYAIYNSGTVDFTGSIHTWLTSVPAITCRGSNVILDANILVEGVHAVCFDVEGRGGTYDLQGSFVSAISNCLDVTTGNVTFQGTMTGRSAWQGVIVGDGGNIFVDNSLITNLDEYAIAVQASDCNVLITNSRLESGADMYYKVDSGKLTLNNVTLDNGTHIDTLTLP
jgi:polygalacturonase